MSVALTGVRGEGDDIRVDGLPGAVVAYSAGAVGKLPGADRHPVAVEQRVWGA
jgi:hypothetical protein